MKKAIGATVAVLLATGMVALTAPGAYATGSDVCTPAEAWTETIAAVGEPTIVVDNPAYVPATPDQEVNAGYIKWTWTGGPVDETPAPPPGDGWHEVGVTNDSKGDQPGVVHMGNGKASYFYYEPITEVIPGTPAQGEPTIEVANPDYVPASTIEHPAVTCDEDPQPGKPAVVVTYGDWTSTGVDCGEGVEAFTRTVFTRDWEWSDDEGTWVPGETAAELETKSEPATAEQCPAPQPVTPAAVTPVTTLAATVDPPAAQPAAAQPAAPKLAVTGGSVAPWLLPVGVLALLAGLAATVGSVRAARR